MHPKFPVRYSVVAVLLAIGASGTAMAADGDVLTMTATAGYNYDSNIFRVASGTTPSGYSYRGDSTWSVSAAADLDKTVGRQRFYGNAVVTDYSYQRFSFLNNDGYQGTLGYRLGFGSDSEAGVYYTGINKLNNFADRSGLYSRNMVNQTRYGGDLLLRVAGDWMGVASLMEGRDTNSVSSQQAGNANIMAYDAGVRYAPRGSGNYIETRYRKSVVDYDAYLGVNSLYNYHQDEERVALLWSPNQISSIEAGAGVVRSSHEHMSSLDFDGWTGYVGYIWRPTIASSTNLRLSRDVGSAGDAWGSYARTNGISVKQTWQATSKISLDGSVQYQDRTYLGYLTADTAAAGEGQRKDKISSFGLGSGYAITNKLQTHLSVAREHRTSNVSGYSYSDLSAALTAQYKF